MAAPTNVEPDDFRKGEEYVWVVKRFGYPVKFIGAEFGSVRCNSLGDLAHKVGARTVDDFLKANKGSNNLALRFKAKNRELEFLLDHMGEWFESRNKNPLNMIFMGDNV